MCVCVCAKRRGAGRPAATRRRLPSPAHHATLPTTAHARVCTLSYRAPQPPELADFGFKRLLSAGSKLLTDNSPEAREAAKQLLPLLCDAFNAPALAAERASAAAEAGARADAAAAVAVAGDGEGAAAAARPPSAWECYCQQALGGSAALAVCKVTGE